MAGELWLDIDGSDDVTVVREVLAVVRLVEQVGIVWLLDCAQHRNGVDSATELHT